MKTFTLFMTALFFLAGCAIGPDYKRPLFDTPDAWRISEHETKDVANTLWWEQFNDPVFNELVQTALRQNTDLKIAAARVEEYIGHYWVGRSGLFPQIYAGGSGGQQRGTENGQSPMSESIKNPATIYQGALTGTWEIDKQRFPNGFKPIADWIHAKGKKFIVWFEPERVGDSNSWLAKNHPEWLLGGRLVNLGDPAARQWVIDRIDSIIKENDIDFYRQDFNMDPLKYWRANDSLDRQGITENFHVQGYLAFWDELKRRNPNMLIDACASGGRRNDLETMRRAVPLLRSDFVPFNQWEAQQAQTYGISYWLPYYGLRVGFPDSSIAKYVYRSFLMPFYGIVRNLKVHGFRGTEFADMKLAKEAVEEFRKVAPMLLGDYYPLTTYNMQLDLWIAWQFDRPEEGDGLIQAYRRENCDESTKTFLLKGLDPTAKYKITNFDMPDVKIISGKELLKKGLTIDMKDKPDAALIIYEVIE